jgi:hypothetical protein
MTLGHHENDDFPAKEARSHGRNGKRPSHLHVRKAD